MIGKMSTVELIIIRRISATMPLFHPTLQNALGLRVKDVFQDHLAVGLGDARMFRHDWNGIFPLFNRQGRGVGLLVALIAMSHVKAESRILRVVRRLHWLEGKDRFERRLRFLGLLVATGGQPADRKRENERAFGDGPELGHETIVDVPIPHLNPSFRDFDEAFRRDAKHRSQTKRTLDPLPSGKPEEAL